MTSLTATNLTEKQLLEDEEINVADSDSMSEELDDDLECSQQEFERAKEECQTNKHVKPPYSYIALITMAVLQVNFN